MREPTAVDAVADEYFDKVTALSPIWLTSLGVPQRQDELDDLSPAGLQAEDDLTTETLRRLDEVVPVDDVDQVTIAAMRERLGLQHEIHEQGQDLLNLNGIATGLHAVRSAFDQMPTSTAEEWDTITARLHAVGAAVDGWFDSQHEAMSRGLTPATRQVDTLASQCEAWVAEGGYFDGLLASGRDAGARDSLGAGVEAARTAYAKAAQRLRDEVMPKAVEADGVGRERYSLWSRYFLGAAVDLDETYAWGWDELARITSLMESTAERIKPGASVKEAVAHLDADPAYQIHGTDALREWMQARADEAIKDLDGTHFDIPEPVRRIEGCIAPTQDGGIYYTGPSDDFTRPGRMWWSVPPGVETFSTWRELTTVYHEGVPGHHLQVAQTAYRRELLNKWRRQAAWTSGHGEGWALYAEWLMADLGYMDDPGNFLGLLDGQSLRAVRVVLDIGVHLGLPIPESAGGGTWTYDRAWEILRRHTNMEEQSTRFELHRYLGWPGQAPSYKIGERLWLQLRDEARERAGADFDLKAFHRRALDLGGLGLDTLRDAVLGTL